MSTQSHLSLSSEQYLTVSQAARLLSVHPSTLRRWIDQGRLPAYRLGEKRIGVREADLAQLISPRSTDAETEKPAVEVERIRVAPLSDREQKQLLAAVEAARMHQTELLAERGGKLFSDSTELIYATREERTKELPAAGH